MEALSEDLRARIMVAVEQWAAQRYGDRLKDMPAEQIRISQSSSLSEADYIVSLDALIGPAPLRVKVVVDHDGELHVRD